MGIPRDCTSEQATTWQSEPKFSSVQQPGSTSYNIAVPQRPVTRRVRLPLCNLGYLIKKSTTVKETEREERWQGASFTRFGLAERTI